MVITETNIHFRIMKTLNISLSAVLAVLFSVIVVTSCSRTDRFAGEWQGQPERIDIPEASNATATVTIDFAPSGSRDGSGNVLLSAVIEVQQPVSGDNPFNQAYEASVAATASVSGRYIAEEGDDDDIMVSFDPSSMQVMVDPDGVTYSSNILTGTPTATLDSMTAATADHWRVILTPVMRDIFNRYTVIDDIEVHHNDMLRCETAKKDLVFSRVGVPD